MPDVATCPACRSSSLAPLTGRPDLVRCRECRWLARINDDGSASTVFDPDRPRRSPRRRADASPRPADPQRTLFE